MARFRRPGLLINAAHNAAEVGRFATPTAPSASGSLKTSVSLTIVPLALTMHTLDWSNDTSLPARCSYLSSVLCLFSRASMKGPRISRTHQQIR